MTENTTIKVTPTSRGNFSKLKKYKEGGIPKYLTPPGGIFKITSGAGYNANDYTTHYNWDNLLNEFNKNKDQFLQNITDVGAFNTRNLWGSLATGQNFALNFDQYIAPYLPQGFAFEGTEAQKEQYLKEFVKRLAAHYNGLGNNFIITNDGKKLYFDQNAHGGMWQELTTTPQGSSAFSYNPEYNAKVPYNIDIDPLTNAAQLANSLITELKVHDLLSNPQFHAPLAYKTGDNPISSNYTSQTLFNKQVAESRSKANNVAFGQSDMTAAMNYLQANEAGIQDSIDNRMLQYDLKYQSDQQKRAEDLERRGMYQTLAANEFYKKADAARAAQLDKDASLTASKGLLVEDAINAWADHSKASNEDLYTNWRNSINSNLKASYDEAYNKTVREYKYRLANTDTSEIQTMFDAAIRAGHFDGDEVVDGQGKIFKLWQTYAAEHGNDLSSFISFISNENNFGDDVVTGKRVAQNYLSKISQDAQLASQDMLSAQAELKAYYERILALYPVKYSGTMPFRLWKRINNHLDRTSLDFIPLHIRNGSYSDPSLIWSNRNPGVKSNKQGGTLEAKTLEIEAKNEISKLERFLKYLDHNRKLAKDYNDKMLLHTKISNERFKAEINQIDRETLLLLREIFK